MVASPFFAGADKELSALHNELGIPVIGPLTQYPQPQTGSGACIFYLDSGVPGQAEALAAFAAGRYPPTSRAALLYWQDDFFAEAAKALRDRYERAGFKVEDIAIVPAVFDARSAVVRLRNVADIVFLLLPQLPLHRILLEVQRTGWRPTLLTPGWLVSPGIQEMLARMASQAVVSYSVLPSDYSSEALLEYRRLAKTYNLPAEHRSVQFAALASAWILTRALSVVGRDLGASSWSKPWNRCRTSQPVSHPRSHSAGPGGSAPRLPTSSYLIRPLPNLFRLPRCPDRRNCVPFGVFAEVFDHLTRF